jgi:hypothetical protein
MSRCLTFARRLYRRGAITKRIEAAKARYLDEIETLHLNASKRLRFRSSMRFSGWEARNRCGWMCAWWRRPMPT